jgi:chloride channel protein, CIC family
MHTLKPQKDQKQKLILANYMKIVVCSAVLGIIVGVSIATLFSLYRIITDFRNETTAINAYLIIILPAAGILLAYTLVYFIGSSKMANGGIFRLLGAYHHEEGRMTLRDTILSPLASMITIGSGGSAGVVGPSVLLGGGLGSLVAQRFGILDEELRIFLLAGASAGIAAVFKAPLTGIIFGLEVPFKRHIARRAFIPATIASIFSYLVFITLQGGTRLFPAVTESTLSVYSTIYNALLLGLATAVAGVSFVKLFEHMGDWVKKINLNRFTLAIFGGLFVGSVGFFIPQVLGTGYPVIESAIKGEITLQILIALLIAKIILTCVTLRFGGSGGLFAPSLFVGAMVGAIYLTVVPGAHDPILIVAAMGASIATTNKTLFTGIVLVVETCGPNSIILTLITVITAYFVSGSVSFYEELQSANII